ncbi:Transient receptor potential cation channel subfamily M member 3 [Trichoplax sp. H2]|nr:Transient receptor potential cation channel subfamily M member 3 [Trichoplax sp. H2]|eukprot:RDD42200.1 Transient receptor potential cation channel subfamily M member 3 [Trichoplax sp. H2]
MAATIDSDSDSNEYIRFHNLEFRSSGYDVSDAVYCKIRDEIDARYLLKGIRKATSYFTKPQLIVSILGGTDRLETLIQREAICRTVNRLTKMARCYLITSGINSGVVRSIAEEIKSRESADFGLDIPLLGVCTYKDVGKHELWSKIKDQDTLIYDISVGDEANHNDLNAFHDCFILVDNSYEGDYHNEVQLRCSLEHEIRNMGKDKLLLGTSTTSKDDDMSGDFIPAVYLLVGGDLRALEMASIALHKGYPVFVIKDTGGSAKLLTNLIENQEDSSPEQIAATFMDIFAFKKKKHQNIVLRYVDMLQKTIALRDQVKIIGIHAAKGFVEEIFEMLLKVHGTEIDIEYKLRFLWGKIDTRKLSEDIINLVSKRKSHRMSLDYLIKCAYIKGLKDVIYTLIRNGTLSYIEALDRAITYEIARGSVETIGVVDFLLDNAGSKIKHFVNLDRIKLMYKHQSNTEDLTMTEAGSLLAKIMDFGYKNPYEEVATYTSVEEFLNAGKDSLDPFRNLFLWAILTGKLELSFLFWKRIKTPLIAALVGYKVLHYYSKDDKRTNPPADHCLELAEKYRRLAYQIVNEAYNSDVGGTIYMLLRELPDWGGVSCFSVIMLTKGLNEFISHDSYVVSLRCIWSGDLLIAEKQGSTPTSLVILATIFPIPFLLILQQLFQTVYCNFYIMKDINLRPSNAIQPHDLETGIVKPTSCSNTCGTCVRISRFYYIPKVKYYLNSIFYLIFLALYGAFITLFFGNVTSSIEIATAIWVLALAVEEISQIMWEPTWTICGKIRLWLMDVWNALDFMAIIIFATAFIMHFFTILVEASRILYCVDLIIFSIRLLQVISPSKNHGPKLIMIRKLLGDLISFLVILFVFLVAFGIASHAILYPNRISGKSAVVSILLIPYWRIFGDLNIDSTENIIKCATTNTSNATVAGITYSYYNCLAVEIVVNALLIIYLLIAIILLLNLLIAILNKRYDELDGDAKKLWAQQFTSLVREYVFRTPFIPPLNLIQTAVSVISHIVSLRLKSLLQSVSDEDFAKSLKLPDISNINIPYDALPDIEEDLKKELIANNAEFGQKDKLKRLQRFWKGDNNDSRYLIKQQSRLAADRFEKQNKDVTKLKGDMKNLRNDMTEVKRLMYNVCNKIERAQLPRQSTLAEQDRINYRPETYKRK